MEKETQHEHTKEVINRMSRVIGHMEAIKKMVEARRDCSDVLIQLSAVRSAINSISRIILEDHINHCVVNAVKNGDQKVIDELNDALDKFLK